MDVLIRHGPKCYGNNDLWAAYRFDSPLTPDGIEVTRQKMEQLISEVGVPSEIRCSPYFRTRQTAEIIVSLCPVTPKVVIDVRLSEFLGHQKGVTSHSQIRRETLVHNPPVSESMEEFRSRVQSYIQDVESRDLTFHVTHGLFLLVASELEGRTIPSGYASLASHYKLQSRQTPKGK